MKLINVLRGHEQDEVVEVRWLGRNVNWSGKGIKFILQKHCNHDWLGTDVKNVTKNKKGWTIITL